jgi:hypothetical protein
LFKVRHAHDHGAARVEREILETPAAVKCPCPIIDRMGDHAEASDLPRSSQRGAQREEEKRARVAVALMILVNRKLTGMTGTGSGLLRSRDFGKKARSICAALNVT